MTVTTDAPIQKPGEPLRLFVRGFLRDHLGLSKIMADSASYIFMDRWRARDEATVKRYNREDVHTLEAAFNRRTLADTDRVLGTTKLQKAETEKGLREQAADPFISMVLEEIKRQAERARADGQAKVDVPAKSGRHEAHNFG